MMCAWGSGNGGVGARSGGRRHNLGIAAGALVLLLAAPSAWSASTGKPYVSAAIVFPADDAAVRANDGQLRVEARIIPALRPDHRVQLLFDSAPHGQPQASARFHLTDVDRGTHQVRLHILDAADAIVFVGQPSQFHLLRHSVLH